MLDERLQAALGKARGRFVDKRRAALDDLPEFESLRQAARGIKDHTLAHLGEYLLRFESELEASAIAGRISIDSDMTCHSAIVNACNCLSRLRMIIV